MNGARRDRMPPGAGGARHWLVVSVDVPPADRAILVVDALRRVGARAVEREGDRVVALFPPPDDVMILLTEARAALRAAGHPEPGLDWRWQPHESWAARWRREHVPRRVGRFLIAATGADPGEIGAGATVLRLDPGVAFGTAAHATTRACLRLLDGRVGAGARVLDVGTGSGILAIAAARLGAAAVLAVEADALACQGARRNVAVNGVADRVRVRELEVGPRELRRLGRYDVVVANLRADAVMPLLPAFPATLRRGASLILSGIVGDEREAVLADARQAGLGLTEGVMEGAWWTGVWAPVAG